MPFKLVSMYMRTLPSGVLTFLRAVTTECGIPLIFDEIVTGFRFAYGGAQEYYGVVPDICTLGKIVAGGFPLAVVAGRADIMRHFDRGEVGDAVLPQIGTLSGNPVASVAGLMTLEVLRRPGTYEAVFATGKRLKDALAAMIRARDLPAQVIGEAVLFDVVFSEGEIFDYRSGLTQDFDALRRFNTLKNSTKGATRQFSPRWNSRVTRTSNCWNGAPRN